MFYRTRVSPMRQWQIYSNFNYLHRLSLQNVKTVKIGIGTPLKSGIYFRFVSEAIGIVPTTFPTRMHNRRAEN